MAINDLTWQQLENASTIGNLLIVDNSQGLLLRLSALTGAISIDKNSSGVVQAMYKLREYCANAQNQVNVGASIGERFAAFPNSVTGTAINGYVTCSGQIITRIPVSTNGILGAIN
jgi:hypothetical protein